MTAAIPYRLLAKASASVLKCALVFGFIVVVSNRVSAASLPTDWLAQVKAAVETEHCMAAVSLMEAAVRQGEQAALYPGRHLYRLRTCSDSYKARQRIFEIGERFRWGYKWPKDGKARIAWLEWAEHLGHAGARYALARIGFRHDPKSELALIRLEWAAADNVAAAQEELAAYLLRHRNDPIGRRDAMVWLLRARDNGAEVDTRIESLEPELAYDVRYDIRIKAAEPIWRRGDLWWAPNFHVALAKSDCDAARRLLDAALQVGGRGAIDLQARLAAKPDSDGCFRSDLAGRKEILEAAVDRLPKDPAAKVRLATFYVTNPGHDSDPRTAEHLLRTAILDVGAAHRPLYGSLRATAFERLTPSRPTAAEAYREAVRWFREIDEQGPYGHHAFGRMFLDGVGLPQDDARAYQWMAIAKKKYHPAAYIDIATLTLSGEWQFEDTEASLETLENAAWLDHGPSQIAVAVDPDFCGDEDWLCNESRYILLVRAKLNGESVEEKLSAAAAKLSQGERLGFWVVAVGLPVFKAMAWALLYLLIYVLMAAIFILGDLFWIVVGILFWYFVILP